MVNVTQRWKDNQTQVIREESLIEVSIQMGDPEAIQDASATDNGSIGDTAQIVDGLDKTVKPYAMCEHNIWPLDGTFRLLPGTPDWDMCYVSDVLCGVDGVFTSIPKIIINFSQVYNKLIPGITITWGKAFGEWATDFTITAYNGPTIVAQDITSGNNNVTSISVFAIQNYNRIEIAITKWCAPLRRARVEDVLIGIGITYRKPDLLSFTQDMFSDPLSATLPKYSISYEIDNVDGSFDPNNLQGLSVYLIERQKISVRYGYVLDGTEEWIPGGVYYLSEWYAPQNGIKAVFHARDILEFMAQAFRKGIYNPYTILGRSLYQLAEQVLISADLPLNPDGNVNWEIDNSLHNIYTLAPLPMASHASCLQIIANAGCCAISFDRVGRMHISPMGDTPTDYVISHFNSYVKTGLRLTKPLKSVAVKSANYITADVVDLFDGEVYVNGTEKKWITYSMAALPHQAVVQPPGVLVSGYYYTHGCELEIQGTGNVAVKLQGNRLDRSELEYTLDVDSEGEPLQPLDNPLITSTERAMVVAAWVGGYLSSRRIMTSNVRIDPRIDPLDIITNQNNYGWVDVRVTKVGINYNGAFRGIVEGRGIDT